MLAYADNMVLAEEEKKIRAMVARLERYVKVKGLVVNLGKLKIIRFEKRGRRSKKVSWKWKEMVIEKVSKFNYLSYMLQRNGRQEE